jgi:hypothetical protein
MIVPGPDMLGFYDCTGPGYARMFVLKRLFRRSILRYRQPCFWLDAIFPGACLPAETLS